VIAAVGSLSALLAMSNPVFAYRPFDCTDADVAAPGEIELEIEPLGYLHTTEGNFLIVPDAVVNYGLRDGWEFVIEGRHRRATSSESDEARSRIEDTGAFLKTVLREGALQDAPGASVAIEFGALLPAVHDESGVGASALIVTSYRWPMVTAHFNAEVALSRSGDVELFGGVILEGHTSGVLRPVMELFVEGEAGQSSTTRSLLLGAIWEARKTLSLDIGARLARVEHDTEYELRAGLTWAFDAEP
jgi:hypothetical protein